MISNCSKDDPDTPECQPGGKEGNFIMYDKANNGGQPNNDKFSPCSIRAIVKTLNSDKVRRPLTKEVFPVILCLETPKAIIDRRPQCGDGIAHREEQCDCGTEEECRVKEPGGCCNPKTCMLREGATCSVNSGRWLVHQEFSIFLGGIFTFRVEKFMQFLRVSPESLFSFSC